MELLPCFRLSWQDWRPDGVTNNNGPLKGWGGRIPALIRWHLIAAQTQGRACTDSVISPAQLMSPAVPKNKIKKKEEKTIAKHVSYCVWEVPRGGCCCKKLANDSDVKLMRIRTVGGGGFWAAEGGGLSGGPDKH